MNKVNKLLNQQVNKVYILSYERDEDYIYHLQADLKKATDKDEIESKQELIEQFENEIIIPFWIQVQVYESGKFLCEDSVGGVCINKDGGANIRREIINESCFNFSYLPNADSGWHTI